jgi:protein involved in polysaccharide export with SLBB domain
MLMKLFTAGVAALSMLAADQDARAEPVVQAAVSSERPLPSELAAASATSARYRLSQGDRLRIRFIDRSDLESAAGEYMIDEAGSIRLPRLGTFQAGGRTLPELESEMRASVESRGEKLGDFIVEVVGYRPVYVAGYVRAPGAYSVQPGSTVIQALSLAGGLYRAESLPVTDAYRERATLAESLGRLRELYARKSRIEAERDEAATIEVPEELLKIDPSNADYAVARERDLLLRMRDTDKREREALSEVIELTEKEIESYIDMQKAMDRRLGEQQKLFERVKELQSKGLINQQRFYEMSASLDSTERDRQLAIAGLANARAKLGKAKRDLEMIDISNNSRIARELADTESEISRLKAVAQERMRLIDNLNSMGDPSGSDVAVRYRIQRRGREGNTKTIDAEETTQVEPGDVIRVLRDPDRLIINSQ